MVSQIEVYFSALELQKHHVLSNFTGATLLDDAIVINFKD